MDAANSRSAVVLCPLAHEAHALRRCLHLPHYQLPRIIQTGPGAAAVARSIGAIAGDCPDRSSLLVVLAGVAGGLAPTPAVPLIRAVINEHGTTFPVTFRCHHTDEDDEERVTILGVDTPLATPLEKQEWNEVSGASLVDTESHAFAAACSRLGLYWAVVRGVSDAFDETLPAQVMGWVGPTGYTRPLRIAGDLLKSPRLIPMVRRLGRRTRICLPQVATRVANLVRAWHAQGLDRA